MIMQPTKLLFLAAITAMAAAPAVAIQTTTPPRAPEDIGIDEHLGERVPLDLVFTDADGRTVALRDYFDGERPVMLTLVYYRCPALCNALLTGLTYSLIDLEQFGLPHEPTPGETLGNETADLVACEEKRLGAGDDLIL